MRPEQWIVEGEVGVSSKTIWAVMMGVVEGVGLPSSTVKYDVPHDPDDFSRCYKLFVLFPEWRLRLSEVAEVFPKWVGFVREWDKLTEMFEKNLRNKCIYSHEMYEFMKTLEEEGMIADGWEKVSASSWHRKI